MTCGRELLALDNICYTSPLSLEASGSSKCGDDYSTSTW